MSDFVVDVESDGPIPVTNSMVCFGVVLVSDPSVSFLGKVRPISSEYIPEALGISGYSRDEHETFDDPVEVMREFVSWIDTVNKSGRPIFWSDNVAHDWQWINYYCHQFVGNNPFGWSGRRIGDLYCGVVADLRANRKWKRMRDTKHTHDPVDDARGNAEALAKIFEMVRKKGE